MNLGKMLPIGVGILGVAVVAQFAVALSQKPEPRYVASWKVTPKSLAEAKGLAKRIVTGVVTKVDRGDDLIVGASGEPNQEDRIPIEVATIRIEGTHKARGSESEIRIFRTGSTKDLGLTDRPAPQTPPPPKPAKGAVERPAQLPKPTQEQARTIMLEDDPPYRVGERYVLLLEDGPEVKVGGVTVKTERPVSPEGRFHVTADRKVQPIAKTPWVLQERGKPIGNFENRLKP